MVDISHRLGLFSEEGRYKIILSSVFCTVYSLLSLPSGFLAFDSMTRLCCNLHRLLLSFLRFVSLQLRHVAVLHRIINRLKSWTVAQLILKHTVVQRM